MKRLFHYVLAAAALIMSLGSCSKDDAFETPKYEQDAAKYVVTNSSNYSSIELTASGNYIIIRNSSYYSQAREKGRVSVLNGRPLETRDVYSPILYGTYTKTGENTYELDGFGTVTVTIDGSGNAYSLEVTPTGGTTETLTASKLNDDIDSDMSNKLCRSWKISRIRQILKVEGRTVMDVSGRNYREMYDEIVKWAEKNGEDPSDYEYEDEDEESWPELVIFTKSGTYMVCYSASEVAVSTWKWKDESKGQLMYSWENDFSHEYSYGIVGVEFNDGQCIVTESHDEEGMEMIDITYLTEAK